MHKLLITGVVLSLIGLAYATRVSADDPPAKKPPGPGPAATEKKPDAGKEPVQRYPWDTDEDYAVRCKLAERLPKIHLEAVPFEQALLKIQSLAGVTIAPNWTALEATAIERDTELTLEAEDLRADRLLELLLDDVSTGEVSLDFRVSSGIVTISTKEDLSRKTFMMVCDCTDLLRADEEEVAKYVDRVAKATLKYSSQDPTRDSEAMERLVRAVVRESGDSLKKELAQAIMNSVDPESWRQNGGNVGSLEFVGTKLIVTQTSAAQMQIFDLLAKVRTTKQQQATSQPARP